MRHQRYCSVIYALRQVFFFGIGRNVGRPQSSAHFPVFHASWHILCIASISFGPPYMSTSIGTPHAPGAFLRLTLCIAFSTSDRSGGGSSVILVDLCWSLSSS